MANDLKYYADILKESAQDLRVLYVEDDPDVQQGIAQILKKFFAFVDVASDGAEGLQKYTDGGFDLVLTDVSMPIMNGVEMSTKIKGVDYNQNIIVISAHNEGEYLIEFINIGIDAFLLKPIQTDMLIKTLGKICSNIHDKKLVVEYQEKMESSYIEMMNQKDALQAELNTRISMENKNIVLVEAVKEQKELPEKQVEYLAKEFAVISANEFMSNYPVDLDIVSDKLLNVGEKIDESIYKFTKVPTAELAINLSDHFAQYSEALSAIPEFVNLNYAISQLSSVFSRMEINEAVCMYSDLLLTISQELERWRVSIFETQDAENVHYLDNSLISDCVMFESFVLGSNGNDTSEDEDFDDMFF